MSGVYNITELVGTSPVSFAEAAKAAVAEAAVAERAVKEATVAEAAGAEAEAREIDELSVRSASRAQANVVQPRGPRLDVEIGGVGILGRAECGK